MDNGKKVRNLIGIATRAGKTVSGAYSTEEAVKAGKACLVIVAGDASANTRKKFSDLCAYYQVPLCCFGEKEELGHSMGKELRSSLAVTDEGLARAIVAQMNSDGGSACESK